MKTTRILLQSAILLLSLTARAQLLQPEVLISFNGTNGANPLAALTPGNDGNFYGTTSQGGSSGSGTVFKVTTNGTLTTLVSFNGADGTQPRAALTPGNDGNFYGTTSQGGSSGYGTVFKVTTNGTLTSLVSFNYNTNGASPFAALTLGNDGDFYGTTRASGGAYGTVFKMTTNGTLSRLVSFNYTNGADPQAGLTLLSDGDFYGTTAGVGSLDGTVFKVTTNGILTTLFVFGYFSGSRPQAGLTLGSDGYFYGTTSYGGGSGNGTVFQMAPNGMLGTLAAFAGANGANPAAALTLGSDGNFYGTTVSGGSDGAGTVFRLSPHAPSLSPLIASQPQPAIQVVPAGVDVSINASVFGALPLIYQWRFNTTNNLQGQTNASLALTNVSLSKSGDYSLYVTNSLGTALSSNAVLTVVPSIATTLPASGLSATGAVLKGSVTLGPNDTLAWFEWGTDTNYGQFDGVTDIPGGSGTVTLTNALSGLDGDLIYHYRVVAWNSFGIVYGTDQSFQVGLIPTAVTLAATVITTNSVALNATVNPRGRHTEVWFKWGTNTSYGNLTPATSVGSGLASVGFSNLIAGFPLNKLYHCRVVASNSLGLATGGDITFLLGAPSAVTEPATFVTGTNAWLNGLVTPNLLATIAWFEWGTNASYGSTVFLGEVGSGGAASSVSNFLNGLDAAVTYRFRLAASNSLGIAFGADALISSALDTYAQSVLADQPLVYYRFEEASGATALNSGSLGVAGNGTFNATVSLGNPSLVPTFGYAAGFTRTNKSGVAVPPIGVYNQVTLEAWIKPRSFSGTIEYNAIYDRDEWFAGGALHFQIDSLSPSVAYLALGVYGNSPAVVSTPALIRTNQWFHLAASYDRVAAKMVGYINGAPRVTNTFGSNPVNLTSAQIGQFLAGYNGGSDLQVFDGLIDEFAIYGTVLPGDRIRAHYLTAIGNPVLLSAQTTNKLNLFWIGPGFRLQSNTNLSNAAGWTNVLGGTNSPVSVTLSNRGNQFFRLKWP